MTKLLDEPWKDWTKENIERGVSLQTIFKTLTENGFDLQDIVKCMGVDDKESSVGDNVKLEEISEDTTDVNK